MNKTLIAALIAATALIPPAALAQERGRARHYEQQRPDSRQIRREAREAYAESRRNRTSEPRAAAPAPAPAPAVRTQQRQEVRQDRRDNRQDFRRGQRDDRQDFRRDQRGDRQDARQDRRDDRQDARQDRRDDRQDRRDYRRGSPQYREALTRNAQQRYDQRRYNDWRDDARYRNDLNDRRSWARNWRNDRRYNWRDYRSRNRNVYHLPRYYAPRGYGYGYRRFSIGLTIGSILFAPNYWIDDPFYYRLPPAYGPYRWVRYYNDALLVDIRTGLVVDVEYDIFW